MSSFALPAWAVWITDFFDQYGPAAWVGAGFAGMFIAALTFALFARGRARFVRSRYDARMIARNAFVDPLAKAYEDKRIFLTEFCLPSHPLIEDKTFINCEIIGPANVLLEYGNSVQEARYPISDAVLLMPNHNLYNAIIVRNCTFRKCSFQRTTFLVPAAEYGTAKGWAMFHWITSSPPEDATPVGPPQAIAESDLPLLPPDTEEEKPR